MQGDMYIAMKKAGLIKDEAPKPAAAPAPRAPAAAPPQQALPVLGDDYVDQAEQVIRDFSQEKNFRKFTTSKIRNILSMISDLYSQVTLNNTGTLTADMQDSLRSMRVRLVYECGRERAVNDFVQRAQLLPYLQGIGNDRQKFLRFARYMEALVAYHRYHGGKD